MTIKERTQQVLKILDDTYGPEKCYLHYSNAHELLIATMLSAQCTDDRVNMVTPALFEKYPTIKAFAEADLADMEEAIRSTGFYHNKAKNIIACCRKLLVDFNEVVPSDIESLTSLPGVGRKTANVVRTHIFNIPSIVVDTHVKRLSNLIGLTKFDDPVKIEFDLMKKLPEDHWSRINTQLIAHGRKVCIARRPKCEICVLYDCCKNKPK